MKESPSSLSLCLWACGVLRPCRLLSVCGPRSLSLMYLGRNLYSTPPRPTSSWAHGPSTSPLAPALVDPRGPPPRLLSPASCTLRVSYFLNSRLKRGSNSAQCPVVWDLTSAQRINRKCKEPHGVTWQSSVYLTPHILLLGVLGGLYEGCKEYILGVDKVQFFSKWLTSFIKLPTWSLVVHWSPGL